ncbi:MAG: hypothetical protein WBX02_12130, partial [Terriglobales bacterium]
MTRAQRIVLIAYCLLLAYCCLWVPWIGHYDGDKLSLGYGWIWAPTQGMGGPGEPDPFAILLRVVAATAVSGAAFLVAGKWKPTDSTRIINVR